MTDCLSCVHNCDDQSFFAYLSSHFKYMIFSFIYSFVKALFYYPVGCPRPISNATSQYFHTWTSTLCQYFQKPVNISTYRPPRLVYNNDSCADNFPWSVVIGLFAPQLLALRDTYISELGIVIERPKVVSGNLG